ncbi:MAG: glycoside hydrolase family 97 catalytic domain-containing protein, partial [Alphaproteobacteria bacterium]
MRRVLFGLAGALVLSAFPAHAQSGHPGQCVDSPGRVLTACVSADGSGAFYAVYRGDRVVIAHSALGIAFEGGRNGPATEIANGKDFSFTQSYPDFDMDAIAAYGRARDVRLIGHNETAGAVENYERQLEAAMTLYEQHG